MEAGKCLAEFITNIIAIPLNIPEPKLIAKSFKGIGL